MKNIIKSTAYSAVALSSIAYTNTFARIDFEWWAGKGDVSEKLKGTWWDANFSDTIWSVVAFFLGFMALVAVIIFIYAGFLILTAGWDEDKVKKGKTTMINALIWIFVIWISWTVVSWFINTLQDSGAAVGQ